MDGHGSPYDRGMMDAYYGRRPDPHFWPDGTGCGERVSKEDMTLEQIAQYRVGHAEQEDRKVW